MGLGVIFQNRKPPADDALLQPVPAVPPLLRTSTLAEPASLLRPYRQGLCFDIVALKKSLSKDSLSKVIFSTVSKVSLKSLSFTVSKSLSQKSLKSLSALFGEAESLAQCSSSDRSSVPPSSDARV